MKIRSLFLCFLLFCFGCNSEEGLDCFKKQGEILNQELEIPSFSEIHISSGIELIVEESTVQNVKISAGENFINNLEWEIQNNKLVLKNNSNCDLLRNYHPIIVHISVPNLKKIYSSSHHSIKSNGVLTFPELTLESGIYSDTSSSIFELEIDNERLTINENVSSVFKIQGKTKFLDVNFWGSNGRLEAENLLANEIKFYHRSTNDIIVFPTEKITGKILSTGNVVLKNVPPIVEIDEIFTGHVVYP